MKEVLDSRTVAKNLIGSSKHLKNTHCHTLAEPQLLTPPHPLQGPVGLFSMAAKYSFFLMDKMINNRQNVMSSKVTCPGKLFILLKEGTCLGKDKQFACMTKKNTGVHYEQICPIDVILAWNWTHKTSHLSGRVSKLPFLQTIALELMKFDHSW